MLSIIKNDWNRIKELKLHVAISIGLTILSVVAAILLTNTVVEKGNIAVVGSTDGILDSKYFNITKLEKAPAKSELVVNRYDACITVKPDHTFKIDTVKSSDSKNQLIQAIKHPEQFKAVKESQTRKSGTNIFGYMMMFLLMQGALYAKVFAEDKEKHVAERVLVSPIPFSQYMLGHAIFIVAMICIPSLAVVAGAKLFGAGIGFGLGQYVVLIGILSILSAAIALCIASFFKVADNSNMVSSVIVVLTSVLGGSFYSFSKGETFLNKVTHLIPQKDLLSFADAWEKNSLNNMRHLELFYVILLTVVLFGIAVYKTRKDYIYSRSE